MNKIGEREKEWGLFISSLPLHEAGHIIFGGFDGFVYDPPFELKLLMPDYNLLSVSAGFLLTLPLLLFVKNKKLLLLVLLIESRWDILHIIQLINPMHI